MSLGQQGANPSINARPGSWSGMFLAQVEQAEVLPLSRSAAEPALWADALGDLRLIQVRGGPIAIQRTETDIRHGPTPTFTFMLQVRGGSTVKHYGHQIHLGEGDFTLINNAIPYNCQLDEASEIILLRVPASIVKEHLPAPDDFCGRRLRADQSLVATAAAMCVSLIGQLQKGLSADCRAQAARHLLGMLSAAYAASFDQLLASSSIMAGRHWKVKLYIEQHLRESDLSPSRIASELKLSARYLRMIFAASNESLSVYILRRRIEECARQLRDPHWRGHSITEIAFSWGFNSAPHFTRSFREQFNLSPRDYRQQQLERSDPKRVDRSSNSLTSIMAAAA